MRQKCLIPAYQCRPPAPGLYGSATNFLAFFHQPICYPHVLLLMRSPRLWPSILRIKKTFHYFIESLLLEHSQLAKSQMSSILPSNVQIGFQPLDILTLKSMMRLGDLFSINSSKYVESWWLRHARHRRHFPTLCISMQNILCCFSLSMPATLVTRHMAILIIRIIGAYMTVHHHQ